MLFVNLSQAPFIISITLILLLFVLSAVLRQKNLRAKFFSLSQQKQLLTNHIKGIRITKNICLAIITILLGLSLLDPRGSSLSSELELEGIDVVLVYDISRSMDVQDTSPSTQESRLNFAKKLGAQLIDSLVGNRIGLVAYAANAIRLLPLTTDVDSVGLFIDELSTDMLSSQSTDIGKALDEAVKNFREDTLTHKSIILFTDGENLDGSVDKSLDIIQQQGISLFIVGMGSEEGGTIPITNPQTGQVTYFRNLVGQNIISKLDTSFLQELASKSRGTYVLGSRASINELSTLIDNISKSPFGTNTQSYLEPKFRLFIICALFALLLYLFLPETKKRKLQNSLGLFIVLFFISSNLNALTPERNAYSSYQNGEYSTALRYYQRSLINNPQHTKSKYGEGASLYKLERGDRAEKAFLALTNDSNPKITQQAIFNAANARIQKKDLEGAIDLFKQVMRNNPIDSRLYTKALNNYIYTRALQQQQNQQQQQQDQENQEEQEKQDGQGGEQSSQNQQQDDQQSSNKQQEGQEKQDSQGQEQANEQDQSPSQSISSSDIDNLLGIAEKDEKNNLSKQFQDKKGVFSQNKY